VHWNDYRKIAEERGALALELFVIESTPSSEPEKIKEILPYHLDYQANLEKRGVLVLAGPLSDSTGNIMNGSGLIVYRAESMKEAENIAQEDPMHKSGTRTFSLRKWLINEGNLSINVGLSTRLVKLS
tara:strand:- start:403 stop:786 length:384 start_codon:yes stop_codon:yes gene_type:complete